MRPTFLIGCHRSGTTLLRYILDSHDNIACPPETKLLTALWKALCHPQIVFALRSLDFSRKDLLVEMGNVATHMLDAYTIRKGKQRWIDKTPNYYTILDQIDEMFENESQYLFLVRHPFDSIVSLEEFFGSPSENHEDPEIGRVAERYGYGRYAWVKYWIEANERILLAKESFGSRALLLRYEDLVFQPKDLLASILEFLGESQDLDILARAFQVFHDDGFQDRKIEQAEMIHTRSIYRGWSQINDCEREVIWNFVKNLAVSFGYTDRRLCDQWNSSSNKDG